MIEKPVSRENLAAGYRCRGERDRALAEEMGRTSRETNEFLGDAPDW